MNRRSIKSSLSGPVILTFVLASPVAFARVIDNGGSATVNPGSTVESWDLRNASGLRVTPGGETLGIVASSGSTVELEGSTTTSAGIGVNLQQGSIGTIRGATITSTGDSGLLLASGATSARSQATVVNSDISGVGRGVSAAFSDVTLSDVRVTGKDAGGSGFLDGGLGLALFGATATITNGSDIIGEKHGVLISANSGSSDAAKFSTLVVDGSRIEGGSGSAIIVGSFDDNRPSQGTIIVQNNSSLIGGNGVILEVANNSTAGFTVDNSNLTGDVLVQEGSHANVTLQNNAILSGQLTNVESLNVNSNATWNMVDSASVEKLTMDGGNVNLRGDNGFRTLTLGSLAGSGTFALGTNLATGEGDLLSVKGHANGEYSLNVKNTGVDPEKGIDLKVVETGGGDARFEVVGGKVDAGTFQYTLEKEGNDWFLSPGTSLTPSTSSVIGLFSAAPTVWYGELSTLRSRMGELRYGNNNGGVWVRSYSNKFNQSAAAGVAYQQIQRGISFGVDTALPSSDGQWLVGLLTGYSKSDLDLQGGTSGDVDSYYVGAYTTWLSDSGYYIDAVIKANRFKNQSDVLMSDGEKSSGDYTNSGIGGSIEAGRHIALADNWFVEPFVQVSALWVSGESYDLDNGMHAKSNHADSFLGKLGGNIGRHYSLAGGTKLQPYLKLAVAEEFANSNRVKVNNNSFRNDLSGTRGEIGAGIAVQLAHDVQLHANVDYMNGSHIEQPWNVNIGASYRW